LGHGWPQIFGIDGLVKSPSAALRFNFVVLAHLQVRRTPQILRALHLDLFTRRSGLIVDKNAKPRYYENLENAGFLCFSELICGYLRSKILLEIILWTSW